MPLRRNKGRRGGGIPRGGMVVIWGLGFSFICVVLDTLLKICWSVRKCQKSVGIIMIWLLVGRFELGVKSELPNGAKSYAARL